MEAAAGGSRVIKVESDVRCIENRVWNTCQTSHEDAPMTIEARWIVQKTCHKICSLTLCSQTHGTVRKPLSLAIGHIQFSSKHSNLALSCGVEVFKSVVLPTISRRLTYQIHSAENFDESLQNLSCRTANWTIPPIQTSVRAAQLQYPSPTTSISRPLPLPSPQPCTAPVYPLPPLLLHFSGRKRTTDLWLLNLPSCDWKRCYYLQIYTNSLDAQAPPSYVKPITRPTI